MDAHNHLSTSHKRCIFYASPNELKTADDPLNPGFPDTYFQMVRIRIRYKSHTITYLGVEARWIFPSGIWSISTGTHNPIFKNKTNGCPINFFGSGCWLLKTRFGFLTSKMTGPASSVPLFYENKDKFAAFIAVKLEYAVRNICPANLIFPPWRGVFLRHSINIRW